MPVAPSSTPASRIPRGASSPGAPRAAARATPRKARITVDRIADAALEIVATRGYEALTMRSVAAQLDTGPASLYAHVLNKADLDELVIGRLCAAVTLPEPDPAAWRAQIIDVCAQLRDQYLAYPGISAAVMGMVVTSWDALQINEGMLSILLAGGIPPQTAAWTIDALSLYVAAYTLEISLAGDRGGNSSGSPSISDSERDAVLRRFDELPAERFPQTRRYAAELTAGSGHERFDFTVGLIVGSLG